MPIGTVVLIAAAILIYFGLAHRVLDRMKLTDQAALGFIVVMLLGGFIDIPVLTAPVALSVNVGGALIPVVLAVYLVTTADTGREKVRAVVASVVTAGAVYAAAKLIPAEPTDNPFLDPTYVFAIIAGIVGYLAGRSRRSAFVAGMMGILLIDFIQFIEVLRAGVGGTTALGGAGIFDSIVLAGIIAVLLAEVIGETRERLALERLGDGGGGLGAEIDKPEGEEEGGKGDETRNRGDGGRV